MATRTIEPEQVDNSNDLIDVRDIIARVEYLRDETAEAHADSEQDDVLDMRAELATLETLLGDLKGNGGDEQWHGDWYPITMVRDSYFERHAEELADDLGLIPANAQWPANCIDWGQAAHQLRMDYTSVEFDGVTYWYR